MMSTPNSATLFWRNRKRSAGVGTPFSPSLLKRPVFLHQWWLIKADTGSHGRGLGVGGFTVLERQGERMFISAPIMKRHDSVTLETADGIRVLVTGLPNKSMTLKNGFSLRVYDHFAIGFPYDWEEYASLSFLENENSTHHSESRENAKDIWKNMVTLVRKDDKSFESCSKETSPMYTPAKESPKVEGEAFASNVSEKSSPPPQAYISPAKESPEEAFVSNVKGKNSPPPSACKSPVKHSATRKSDLKRNGVELSGPMTRSKARKLDK